MKKSVILFGLAALLVMSACTTKKGLPNYGQDQSGTVLETPVKIEISSQVEDSSQGIDSSQGNSSEPGNGYDSDMPYDSDIPYDIEIAFDDPVFMQIMEGEIVPVKVCHGLGGEGGYTQDWSDDPNMIDEYIYVFRNLKLEEVITDEKDFNRVFDGINDYIFELDDGTDVLISMDLNAYVTKDDTQYVFGYSQELHDLNELISEVEYEP